MALDNNVKKWWDSFVIEFDKLGYDINNPADRYFLQIFEGDINNVDDGAMLSACVEKEHQNKEYDTQMHTAEWILKQQRPVDESLINDLYTAAKENRLMLQDIVYGAKKSFAPLETRNVRAINISSRSGEVCISEPLEELLAETEILCTENAVINGYDMSKRTNAGKRMEEENKLQSEWEIERMGDIVQSDLIANMKKNNGKYLSQIAAGLMYKQADSENPVYGKEMTYEEYEKLREDVRSTAEGMPDDDTYIAMGHAAYLNSAIREVHRQGYMPAMEGMPEGFITMEGPADENPQMHLNKLLSTQNGVSRLSQLIPEGFELRNENGSEFKDDNAKLQEKLKAGEVYCYKDGVRGPKLKFDELTNSLMIAPKTPEVTKPGSIASFFDSILKHVGIRIPAVKKYEEYEKKAEVCKEFTDKTKVLENAGTRRRSEETKTPVDNMKEKFRKSFKTYMRTEAKMYPDTPNPEEREICKFYKDAEVSLDMVNTVLEGKNDISILKGKESRTLASVFAASIMSTAKEEEKAKMKEIMDNHGYDSLVNVINGMDEVDKAKNELSLVSLKVMIGEHGRTIIDIITKRIEGKTNALGNSAKKMAEKNEPEIPKVYDVNKKSKPQAVVDMM